MTGWMTLLVLGTVINAADSTSVSEMIGVVEYESLGSIVTVGLSDYKGSVNSSDIEQVNLVDTIGNTLILHAHEGRTFGYGARLQYTLYGADAVADTYKITAHTNARGDSKVLIGIYSISEPPKVEDNVSGYLGDINRDSSFYNGEEQESRKQKYEGLFPDGDAPAMFLLKEKESVDIIVNISAADTWTGSSPAEGAWVFYELLEQETVEIYFTIVPQ